MGAKVLVFCASPKGLARDEYAVGKGVDYEGGEVYTLGRRVRAVGKSAGSDLAEHRGRAQSDVWEDESVWECRRRAGRMYGVG
jgi:hypothetical protein